MQEPASGNEGGGGFNILEYLWGRINGFIEPSTAIKSVDYGTGGDSLCGNSLFFNASVQHTLLYTSVESNQVINSVG